MRRQAGKLVLQTDSVRMGMLIISGREGRYGKQRKTQPNLADDLS